MLSCAVKPLHGFFLPMRLTWAEPVLSEGANLAGMQGGCHRRGHLRDRADRGGAACRAGWQKSFWWPATAGGAEADARSAAAAGTWGRTPGRIIAELSVIAEVKRVGSEITAAEPRIDVLINNAGNVFANRGVARQRARAHLRDQPHGVFRAHAGPARAPCGIGAGPHRQYRLAALIAAAEPGFHRPATLLTATA